MDRFTVDDILCYQTQLSGCKELIKYSDHLEATNALQAKIDALMLEYCPEDMTEEQIENWGNHQESVNLENQSE